MRISDWSSDVCSSDLSTSIAFPAAGAASSAAGTRKPICPSGKRKATGEYAGEYVCRRLGFARPCFHDGRHGPPARGRRPKTGRHVLSVRAILGGLMLATPVSGTAAADDRASSRERFPEDAVVYFVLSHPFPNGDHANQS